MYLFCLCDYHSSISATPLRDVEASSCSGENMSAKNSWLSPNPELPLQHSGCVCCFYSHELIEVNVSNVTEESLATYVTLGLTSVCLCQRTWFDLGWGRDWSFCVHLCMNLVGLSHDSVPISHILSSYLVACLMPTSANPLPYPFSPFPSSSSPYQLGPAQAFFLLKVFYFFGFVASSGVLFRISRGNLDRNRCLNKVKLNGMRATRWCSH